MNSIEAITQLIFIGHTPTKCDLIIIPGTATPQLAEKASEIFLEGLSPIILTTGGKIKNMTKEFLLQKDLLIEHGIPKEAIYTEERSMNTKENAVFSKKVIEENNLKHKRIMIVCKPYHSRRVYMTFKTSFPNSDIVIIPAENEKHITKDNWYKNKDSINVVMGAVRRIGEYTKKGDLSF